MMHHPKMGAQRLRSISALTPKRCVSMANITAGENLVVLPAIYRRVRALCWAVIARESVRGAGALSEVPWRCLGCSKVRINRSVRSSTKWSKLFPNCAGRCNTDPLLPACLRIRLSNAAMNLPCAERRTLPSLPKPVLRALDAPHVHGRNQPEPEREPLFRPAASTPPRSSHLPVERVRAC